MKKCKIIYYVKYVFENFNDFNDFFKRINISEDFLPKTHHISNSINRGIDRDVYDTRLTIEYEVDNTRVTELRSKLENSELTIKSSYFDIRTIEV